MNGALMQDNENRPHDDTTSTDATLTALRSRAEALERELHAARQEAEARLVQAELKAEAVRAGMIDLDGLKLIDLANVRLDARGEVAGATQIMTDLKRTKPWLFGIPSSSSGGNPPPAQPPRSKLAMEMTDAEYRAARADLLRRR
jgi:hypothetical protein